MVGIIDSPFLGLFSKYFCKKRSLANGVAFAGSSLGGLVLPLLLRWSIDKYTVRGAMFFMGGVWMHSCVVAAVMCPLPARDRVVLTVDVPVDDFEGEKLREAERNNCAEQEKTDRASYIKDVSDGTAVMAGDSHESMKSNTNASIQNMSGPDKADCSLVLRHPSVKSSSQSQAAKGSGKGSAGQESSTAFCFAAVRSVILDYVDFLSNAELLRFSIALFLCGFAYLNQLVFWPAYAEEIGMSKLDGSLVVSVCGITELLGRPFLGYLGCRLNKILLCLVTNAITCLMGIVAYMLPYRGVLLGYAAVFGLTGGSTCVLGVPIMSEAAGPEHIGSAAGLFPLALGLGAAVGPPFLGKNYYTV